MLILPTEAVLHVTTCCSHHCDFCYAINDHIAQLHQDKNTLEKIIIKLAEAGCKKILFVGGDPASHPDIVNLALTAKSLGLETSILSNTLYFENYSLKNVISAFANIEATIHRSTPKMHDEFCKKEGAYNFVINNLKSLKSETSHLGIVFNITPDTYTDIGETIKRVIEIDDVPIDHVILQRIVSIGRAYQKSEWNLSSEFFDVIFSQTEKAKSIYSLDISFEDTFPLCKVPKQYRQYIHPCSWGQNGVSLDMYGNIAKCCTDPRYIIGNVLTEPLSDIWNSTDLTNRRRGDLVPQTCRDCFQYAECGGGCILASEMNMCKGDPLLASN